MRKARGFVGLWAAQLVLFALLGVAVDAPAAEVTLAWDANPPAEEVEGYVVFWGPSSRHSGIFLGYAHEVNVIDGTEVTVDIGEPTGPTYFAAIAYNRLGLRSAYSDELVLPGMTAPAALRFGRFFDVESDGDVDGADLGRFAAVFGAAQ